MTANLTQPDKNKQEQIYTQVCLFFYNEIIPKFNENKNTKSHSPNTMIN